MKEYLKFTDNNGKKYMLVKSRKLHFPFFGNFASCNGCAFQKDDKTCRAANCLPKGTMGEKLVGNNMIWKEIK